MKIIVMYGCSSIEMERGIVQAQSVARQISNLGHQATVVDASNIAPVYQQTDNGGRLQECILNEFWIILREADVVIFALGDNLSHVPEFMYQVLLRAPRKRSTGSNNMFPSGNPKLAASDDEVDDCPRTFTGNTAPKHNNLTLSQQLKESKMTTERILNSSNYAKAMAKLIRLKQYQIWNYNGINYGLVTLSAECRHATVELWTVLQSLESVYLSGMFRYGIPNMYSCDPSLETAGPCIG